MSPLNNGEGLTSSGTVRQKRTQSFDAPAGTFSTTVRPEPGGQESGVLHFLLTLEFLVGMSTPALRSNM